MWVTLEYSHCKEACLCTADNEIVLGSRDPFSVLFNEFIRDMAASVEVIGLRGAQGVFQSQAPSLLLPLQDMRRNVQSGSHGNLSYGYALFSVAERACTTYSDRFTAMAGFLQIADHGAKVLNMPQDPADACLWLALRCL